MSKRNGNTSQRYRCHNCGYSYTPDKKVQDYSRAFRQKAIKMYFDGAGLRRTGRQLGIHHQTVANWAKEESEQLPEAPMPVEVKTAKFDEIFTFIGDKKNRITLITLVDRDSRCFLDWKVAWERSQELVQAIVDHAPKANWYYSDGLDVYASLWYHWGCYAESEGEKDTYSVEGNNAELRHYLARLARSSRCFSRCQNALLCAVRLFVYYFNQRQLRKHQFPKYSFNITDFVHSPF